MPDCPRVVNGSDQQEAVDDGYFAPLASAMHMRLTTFGRDGTPASATVRGLADGDRAYVRARSQSPTAKRLRLTGTVQVTPCSVLGLCTYGPPLDASARLLPAGEASRAAAELGRRSLVRHRSPIPLPGRWRRAQYYELVADDVHDEHSGLAGEFRAPLIIKVDAREGFVYADAARPASLDPACAPSKTPSRPSRYTQIITVRMSRSPARAGPKDASGFTSPPSGLH